MLKSKIKDYFEVNREAIERDIVALTTEMCRERTVNVTSDKLGEHPYLSARGDEYRVADIVKRSLDEWHIPYQQFARIPERPNVVGTVGRGKSNAKLLVAAHMDVVPAGDGWTSDPWQVIVRNGNMIGRGVLDNKGPLASSLVAARVMKQVVGDDQLAGQFMISALSDEEATDPDGVDYGIEFLLAEKHIQPTCAIIPDIGENMKRIDIAEKGRMVVKITSIGKQAHGSTPERGVNAIYPMAALVSKFEKMRMNFAPHPLLVEPTMNLGEIHGGAAANIVAGECSIVLDIRTLPGQTREKVVAELQRVIDSVPGTFKIHIDEWSDPHKIEPDNPLVKAIQQNTQEFLGFTPETFGMGGGTFAKTLVLNGIPAVGFGPGDDDAFHLADEYVEIKQLVDFAGLMCLVAVDLLA
ncbi:ArgE/DapE family deacylase [candidate division KSB1 bacterium]|nr:ArgE/DapE family deacylase [candidate division KSB1 bacterium]